MNQIATKIREVRLIKHRSLHDCAKFLGISKEEYLKFEEDLKENRRQFFSY